MRRGLAWLGGALGVAALWRYLQREQPSHPPAAEPAPDPAAELRARLDEARDAPDDRDDFDAAEGQPVDQAEPREPEPGPESEPAEARSLEERRRAIHEKAQEALGEMQGPSGE
jgi:hypothetical protein